jgi:hypothetical protein
VEQCKAEELARLQDAASAEARFTKLNSAKVCAEWRRVMRAAKVETLRRQQAALEEDQALGAVRVAARTAQLRRDLAAAEKLHAAAVRTHNTAVEQLLALQRARGTALVEAFDRHVAHAQSFLTAQRAAAVAAHSKRVAELRQEVAAVRARGAASAAAAQEAWCRDSSAVRSAGEEELEVVRLSGEAALNELRARLAAAERVHAESTTGTVMKAAVEALTAQEAASAKALSQRTRELAKVHEAAATFRAASDEAKGSMEGTNSELRGEKDALLVQHNELKRTMDRSRDADAARLRDAVVAAHAKARALTDALAKVQKITRLAELNARSDAQQRSQLAALGVLEEPGSTMTQLAARERSRLRGQAASAEAERAAASQLGVTGSSPPRTMSPTRGPTPSLDVRSLRGTPTPAPPLSRAAQKQTH